MEYNVSQGTPLKQDQCWNRRDRKIQSVQNYGMTAFPLHHFWCESFRVSEQGISGFQMKPRVQEKEVIVGVGDWLGQPAKINDENNGTAVYLRSSLTDYTRFVCVFKH